MTVDVYVNTVNKLYNFLITIYKLVLFLTVHERICNTIEHTKLIILESLNYNVLTITMTKFGTHLEYSSIKYMQQYAGYDLDLTFPTSYNIISEF